MNWIDNVLAVPAIGIRINTKFGVVAEFQKVLYYFLDGLAKELDDLQILPEELWGYKAESKNGYSFNYSNKNLVTSFKYNIGRKRKPGKLPTLTAPELMSYSSTVGTHESDNDRHLSPVTFPIQKARVRKTHPLNSP